MSPIDKNTVGEKLKLLVRVVAKLDDIKAAPQKDFFSDFRVSDAALRNLTLGIEIVVDVGNHLLAEEFQDSARTYKDVIIKLGEDGIVPEEFANENVKMADFRNLAIHGYLELDLDKVYENLQKAPDIFRQFAKYLYGFLEKQSK